MGCWNGTCGVTQLPIHNGDKVRAFILVPHYSKYGGDQPLKDSDIFAGGGTCYSGQAYSPLTIPIEAEYNDYGSIENAITTPNTDAIVKYFNEMIKDNPDTFPDYDDDKFDNIEDVFTAVERCDKGFSMMLVLDSVYKGSIAALELTLDQKYDTSSFYSYILEDLRLARNHLAKQSVKKITGKLVKNLKEEDPLQSLRFLLGPAYPKQPGAVSYRDNAATYLHKTSSESGGLTCTSFAAKHMNDILSNATMSLEEIADHIHFYRFMSAARKQYISQTGQGSQSSEYKLSRLLADIVIEHVAQVEREQLEEYGDDLPEDDEELLYIKAKY